VPTAPDISDYAAPQQPPPLPTWGDPEAAGAVASSQAMQPFVSGFGQALGGDLYDIGKGIIDTTGGTLQRVLSGQLQPGTPEFNDAARQSAVTASGVGGAGSLIGAGEEGVVTGMARARRLRPFVRDEPLPALDTPPPAMGGNMPPESLNVTQPSQPGMRYYPSSEELAQRQTEQEAVDAQNRRYDPSQRRMAFTPEEQAIDQWVQTGRLPPGFQLRAAHPNSGVAFEAYRPPPAPLPYQQAGIDAVRNTPPQRPFHELTPAEQRAQQRAERELNGPPVDPAYAGRPTSYPGLPAETLNQMRERFHNTHGAPMGEHIEQAMADAVRHRLNGSPLDEAQALYRMQRDVELEHGGARPSMENIMRRIIQRRDAEARARETQQFQTRDAQMEQRQRDVGAMREVPEEQRGSRLRATAPVGKDFKLHRTEGHPGTSGPYHTHRFDVRTPNGQTHADLTVTQIPARNSREAQLAGLSHDDHIVHVDGFWGQHGDTGNVGALGPREIRNLYRQLKEHFPDTKGIEGFRVSGAREWSGGGSATAFRKWMNGGFIPWTDLDQEDGDAR
jgi:hypothetical protein